MITNPCKTGPKFVIQELINGIAGSCRALLMLCVLDSGSSGPGAHSLKVPVTLRMRSEIARLKSKAFK